MSKGYLFQPSFLELLETFDKASDRDALNMAIHRFMIKGEEPEFKKVELKRAWIGLYPYLSKSRKISLSMSKETSDNLPSNFKDTSNNLQRNFQDTSKKLPSISKETSDNLLSKEREKEKDIGEKKVKEKSATAAPVARFIKPTLDQVKEYVAEKGYHFDAVAFHAFYESKGWRVGNQPMKSWEAACITWEKREPHPEAKEEVKQKPVPKVTQCPTCGSYELRITLDRVMCKSCGACYDYNHTKEKWEAV